MPAVVVGGVVEVGVVVVGAVVVGVVVVGAVVVGSSPWQAAAIDVSARLPVISPVLFKKLRLDIPLGADPVFLLFSSFDFFIFFLRQVSIILYLCKVIDANSNKYYCHHDSKYFFGFAQIVDPS